MTVIRNGWKMKLQKLFLQFPIQSVYAAGGTLTKRLEDGKVRYDLAELENLRLFFLSVIEMIEKVKAGSGTAKEPDPLPAGKRRIA
jgi:hypothetical protein